MDKNMRQSDGRLVNTDPVTGIAYGVIPIQDVCQSWCDSSESVYGGDCSCRPDDCEDGDDFECFCEPTSHEYEREGIEAAQFFDNPDIFISKSPVYTLARECSPCAPNACYLRDFDLYGFKAYCFPADWFERGGCPYMIWEVETDKLVYVPFKLVDRLTIGQLNELAQPIPGSKMSVYENQFGYANIVQIGDNVLCRVQQSNTGIISADCFFEIDDCYSLDENLQQFLEQEVEPKLREEFEENHTILTLPSYLASYLINGDASGLNDAEQSEIDSFILKADVGFCVGCSEESWFANSNDLDNMGADVLEFYFRRIK